MPEFTLVASAHSLMALRALAAQNYRTFSSFLFFEHTGSQLIEVSGISAQPLPEPGREPLGSTSAAKGHAVSIFFIVLATVISRSVFRCRG